MNPADANKLTRKRRPLGPTLGLLAMATAGIATLRTAPATPLPPAPGPAPAVETAVFAVG